MTFLVLLVLLVVVFGPALVIGGGAFAVASVLSDHLLISIIIPCGLIMLAIGMTIPGTGKR